MNSTCIRGLLTCSDCSKPRVVYSRYKPSGKGIRTVNQELDVLESKGEFKCGTDITKIFEKDKELKTKIVTVDRRLSCADPIETRFYSQFEDQNGICAFCTTELKEEDTQQLKTLIENKWKVQPSCAQTECLSLNPKANYKQGWTAHAKQDRKRKQAEAPPPRKKPKKTARRKPKKPERRKPTFPKKTAHPTSETRLTSC